MKQAFFEPLENRQMFNALGVNLVINGGFELGMGSSTGLTKEFIPGWESGPSSTVVKYGAPDGFPSATSPGPADRGANFLAGGVPSFAGASPTTSQSVDVSGVAADIDAGRIRFDLSAFLGGFGSQRDFMFMRYSFRDAAGGEIDFQGRSGPTAAERNSVTGFQLTSATGQVPVGTRAIKIDLIATLRDGTYADGYADNVSLKLSSTADNGRGFVSGVVYNDLNGNKTQNSNDKGMAGVTVFADRNGNRRFDRGELSATSGADGKYVIANVPAGTTTIRQIVPSTFRATDAGARTVNVRSGLTTAGQKFGVSQTIVIGGSVFSDNNGDRRRNVGEGGLAGTKVFLDLNGNGERDAFEQGTTTDANGNYAFVTKHGTYTVRQETPAGRRQSTPVRDAGIVVKLAKGKTSLTNVFGLRPI